MFYSVNWCMYVVVGFFQTLSDIQIAMKVLHEGDKKENPLDRHYHSLHCDLEPVDKEDDVFGTIEKYVKQTHASTHNLYRLEVQQVFLVNREGEELAFKDKGNRSVWRQFYALDKGYWAICFFLYLIYLFIFPAKFSLQYTISIFFFSGQY